MLVVACALEMGRINHLDIIGIDRTALRSIFDRFVAHHEQVNNRLLRWREVGDRGDGNGTRKQ